MIFADNLSTWALFVEFALAAAVVIVAGSKLTRMADQLADRLNIASGWIGLILLATVTSLPELITGGTATAIGNVDLALGGILGSCCFNITLIFLLNLLWRGGSVLSGVGAGHSLTSSFGLLLIGEALLGIVLLDKFAASREFAQIVELCWVALIAVTYLGCMKLVYRFERDQRLSEEVAGERPQVESAVWVKLAALATILVAASWWLALIGDVLSTHKIEMIGRPLGATFVGACFLALATSLPEIATSVAAVRLGNLDLALGNIFGSNMFNIFVVPFLKIVSVCDGSPLLLAEGSFSGTQNLITGLLAILLTAIALGGLACKSKRIILKWFGFDSILIALTYAGGMLLLLMGGGR